MNIIRIWAKFSTMAMFAVLAICLAAYAPKPATNVKPPIVIMIGIDGLRWDAIDRFPAPTLHNIAEHGVRAERLIPVMPTMTFVNFYSLATGLYAENTGITTNMPYSKAFDDVMARDMHGQGRWWGGEPIWVSAEKQNVRTATMFWLGSEAEIKNTRPSHWLPYQHNKSHQDRVAQVVEWLSLPEADRPRLITLYYSAVDSALHRYGVETPEEGNAIKAVDDSIASLRQEIEALGLTEQVNLIVVSDHGMTDLDPKSMVYLDDYFDLDTVFIPSFHSKTGAMSSPFTHVFVKDPTQIDDVYQKMKNSHPAMKVFKREDIPKNWHLNNADRTGDIFAAVDPGYMIFARSLTSIYKYPAKGMHGFDRFAPDMGASFMATGPNFKSGQKVEAFENVEIYGMIARILGITPAQTDGDIKNVEGFMVP